MLDFWVSLPVLDEDSDGTATEEQDPPINLFNPATETRFASDRVLAV